MPLRPDELDRRLKAGLAPVYLVAGEEPLFVQETLDVIRAAARAGGCSEREILNVEPGFDWGRLSEAAGNLSLFGERRLIELRMPTGKPGAPGAKALAAYCEAPSQDVILLVACEGLDAGQRKSAWVNALDRAGVFVYVWPLPLAQLPKWINERLRRRGLSAPPEAVALLAERAEGNLLAAAQEIDKLALLFGQGALSLEQIAGAVADSARYTVFDLAEAVSEGALPRALRIVRGLREEGVDPTLVLWSLARELRTLAELAAQGVPAEVFRRNKVFGPRQAKAQQAARRAPAPAWQRLLVQAARTDRVIKGLEPGRPWDELLQLTSAFARVGRQ